MFFLLCVSKIILFFVSPIYLNNVLILEPCRSIQNHHAVPIYLEDGIPTIGTKDVKFSTLFIPITQLLNPGQPPTTHPSPSPMDPPVDTLLYPSHPIHLWPYCTIIVVRTLSTSIIHPVGNLPNKGPKELDHPREDCMRPVDWAKVLWWSLVVRIKMVPCRMKCFC